MSTITILILINIYLNAFLAGMYVSDNKNNIYDIITIIIILIIGFEIMIIVYIWNVIRYLGGWFICVTQINFWYKYMRGKLNQMEGEALVRINDHLKYRSKNNLTNRHIKFCVAFLNEKYQFDYNKFAKEREKYPFIEPEKVYHIKKA